MGVEAQEAVGSPCLEPFKPQLDMALSNLIQT